MSLKSLTGDPVLLGFALRVKLGEEHGEAITPEVLDYIAEGLFRYLDGNKTPWPQKRGRKKTPKKSDCQVWYDYKTSKLSKVREGELLASLKDKYSLSDSGVLDSVRRISNFINNDLSRLKLNPDYDNRVFNLLLGIKYGFSKDQVVVIENHEYFQK